MKKMTLMLSLILIAGVRCNRDEIKTESETQREEIRPLEEDYREDGARITQPIDERIDLEEEP